jgi:hypothetical protein
MQGAGRATKVICGAAAGWLLAVGSLYAAENAGGGVTLVNESNRVVTVFVRHGSDGACSEQSKTEEVTIPPGQSRSVDGGKACICLQMPERNTCPTGWSEVKAGGKRVFR